jgi:hypothetical protein
MLADSPGVRHDPLRSSGGLHEANRLQRGVAEFLRLPLIVTAAFCLVAVGVSLLDRLTPDDAGVRTVVRSIVSEEGAVDFLAAVATSLLTVTSITFSVLLLAVQQTASSLTPVVFDQFLRRTSNQLYFGFFIGATAFSFLVLGLARQQPAPLYSAALTLVLVVASLVVLLMLIHSTIDQMRPESVVRSIHELALRAREVELKMLGRTRMARHSDPDEPEREVHAMDTGFVVTVDTEKLGQIASAAGNDVEVIVEGRLGEYLVFDDLLVRLVGVEPEDSSYDEEVISAFGIDDIRDVNVESGYALDQLENIAWRRVPVPPRVPRRRRRRCARSVTCWAGGSSRANATARTGASRGTNFRSSTPTARSSGAWSPCPPCSSAPPSHARRRPRPRSCTPSPGCCPGCRTPIGRPSTRPWTQPFPR